MSNTLDFSFRRRNNMRHIVMWGDDWWCWRLLCTRRIIFWDSKLHTGSRRGHSVLPNTPLKRGDAFLHIPVSRGWQLPISSYHIMMHSVALTSLFLLSISGTISADISLRDGGYEVVSDSFLSRDKRIIGGQGVSVESNILFVFLWMEWHIHGQLYQ